MSKGLDASLLEEEKAIPKWDMGDVPVTVKDYRRQREAMEEVS